MLVWIPVVVATWIAVGALILASRPGVSTHDIEPHLHERGGVHERLGRSSPSSRRPRRSFVMAVGSHDF